MTPERWKRTEELYHQARARLAGDRKAFLAVACPDDAAMRSEVESLLDKSESHDGFLGEPALVITASEFVPTTMMGTSLGGCHLQGLVGVVGMGEVYSAASRPTSPLQRSSANLTDAHCVRAQSRPALPSEARSATQAVDYRARNPCVTPSIEYVPTISP